jgi:hypothetical protein
MSAPTLVFTRAHYVDGKLVHRHGDEVPPGLFTQDVVNKALDEGWLSECEPHVRRSLYQLFPRFRGSSQQKQQPEEH